MAPEFKAALAIRASPSWPSCLRPIHRIGRLRWRATGFEVVGLGRLELPTSRLSSARSNQLSYKPDEASSSGLQPDGANHDGKRKGNEGGGTAPLSKCRSLGNSRERPRN